MKMKSLYISSLFFLLLVRASAQESLISSKGDSPQWITGPPAGYQNDYFVGEGEGSSLPEASKNALGNAVTKYLQTKSFEAKSSMNLTIQQKGNELSKTITEELSISGSSSTIKGLVQEETYYESWSTRNGVVHRYWVLIKIPKTSRYRELPTQAGAVWRSIIGPGWGQFYKGQNTKGYIIAISEVLLIPAGFILQSLKTTADVDAQGSRTQVLRDYYVDQANTYYNISTGCFIAAGAMYIFNILDATISKGEKVYVDIHITNNELKMAQGNQTTLRLNIRF